MSGPRRDPEFEAFLEQRTVLPAALQEQREPPAALDEVVLQKAREAIGAPRAGFGPPVRPPRWAIPVAVAATVLLCLSIVMNISLNAHRPAPHRERDTAAAAASPRTRAAVAGSQEAESASPGSRPQPGPASSLEDSAETRPAPLAAQEAKSAAGAIAQQEEALTARRKADAVLPAPKDPRAWLRRIDALRAAGKTVEADAEMQRFRAAFPRYPVPRAPD
jgi:hypothetical protein